MRSTRVPASSVDVSGRPSITLAPCATTRSRLHACGTGYPQCRAVVAATSPETLARFEATHVGTVEPAALRTALAASVLALMHEGAEAELLFAPVVAERLAELR